MDTKEKFSKMVAFDFSNLKLEQYGNENCYTTITNCVCDAGCDSGDCDCNDDCYCDSNW